MAKKERSILNNADFVLCKLQNHIMWFGLVVYYLIVPWLHWNVAEQLVRTCSNGSCNECVFGANALNGASAPLSIYQLKLHTRCSSCDLAFFLSYLSRTRK